MKRTPPRGSPCGVPAAPDCAAGVRAALEDLLAAPHAWPIFQDAVPPATQVPTALVHVDSQLGP
eukprot:1137592-Pyramimonas_sp.AAC.2